MTAFKKGQKVVCIDDRPIGYPTCDVKKGEIYTIEDIVQTIYGLALKLVGIKSAYNSSHLFFAFRFRPIQYTSASAEILEKFPLIEERADVETKEVVNN